ncbi:MAG TPA: isocitrate lyase/phosphoenolpyruvate mutase family protein [Solirubrobacteraceae bacterium]|nr:isocitrate lyase/phosphoenolpyruvate mutase family protein [Solirubrobacteraceae bacterium]
MPTASHHAEELRRLHEAPELLVLVNVWDAVSARVVAAQPGCRAVATASWSVAAALGARDGERLSREDMLAAVARVAAAVEIPVSADLERGYGATPADVGETMRAAAAAGAAGCNIEDGVDGALRPRDDAVARVAAAVDAGLVVNARTDPYLLGRPDAFDIAAERGQAFVAAGAQCVFVPGVTARDEIARLVDAIGPISVLVTPASPPLEELERLGVRRVSVGPGSLGVAMAALAEAAAGLLARAPYPPALGYRG